MYVVRFVSICVGLNTLQEEIEGKITKLMLSRHMVICGCCCEPAQVKIVKTFPISSLKLGDSHVVATGSGSGLK